MNTCFEMYNCCNCGGHECGCRYCFSCNACENCMRDDGDADAYANADENGADLRCFHVQYPDAFN